ncbi:MAG: transglutaminase-like domain-containing protein, partial [Anaerolineae bacterium]
AVVRLSTLLQDLTRIPFTEGATADNHVFLFLLALLTWMLAHFSAWAVFRRRQVWWAIIMWGTALLINMTYASENLTIFLFLFLLAALMMVVRANLALYEEDWRQTHVNYSSDLIFGFLRAGLMISLIAILLAWVAPVALASRPLQPFWDKVGEPWRRLQQESARIFENLNYQNEPPLIALGDRRMWFGGPVSLEDVPVADVEAETGRYWRVMAFHEYTGDGWATSDPDIVLIGANEQDLAAPALDLRVTVTQTITVFRDWPTIEPLIAAAQPLRSELPLRASVTFLNQPGPEPQDAGDTTPQVTPDEAQSVQPTSTPLPQAPGDPSAIYSRLTLFAGDSYRVVSSLTEVDRDSLREASTDYPDSVVPRYLQLPDSLPERVRLLAEQITEGLETPYDKAKAIESALRKIPYDDQIEAPGLTQDGVDYFLFEVQAGYCDYYASAMVVLLRSVGVPARYVRGYSEGEADDGTYHLLESDGHAWAEVYFPGYGWIEFEPTGGEPALNRPGAQSAEEPERSSGGTGRIPDM